MKTVGGDCGMRPEGRKSRPKADSGGRVLGEGQHVPSPSTRGVGSTVSSPSYCAFGVAVSCFFTARRYT